MNTNKLTHCAIGAKNWTSGLLVKIAKIFVKNGFFGQKYWYYDGSLGMKNYTLLVKNSKKIFGVFKKPKNTKKTCPFFVLNHYFGCQGTSNLFILSVHTAGKKINFVSWTLIN